MNKNLLNWIYENTISLSTFKKYINRYNWLNHKTKKDHPINSFDTFEEFKFFVDNFGDLDVILTEQDNNDQNQNNDTNLSNKEFNQQMRQAKKNYSYSQNINNLLLQAEEKKVCIISYEKRLRDGQRRLIRRLIEPYSLKRKYNKKQKTSFIYLYGFCLEHNEIHSFRLDRLKRVEVTQTKYNPRWDIEIQKNISELSNYIK